MWWVTSDVSSISIEALFDEFLHLYLACQFDEIFVCANPPENFNFVVAACMFSGLFYQSEVCSRWNLECKASRLYRNNSMLVENIAVNVGTVALAKRFEGFNSQMALFKLLNLL